MKQSTVADRKQFTVEASDTELRLDQLLAARIDGLSRRKARVLLDIGGVYVDGRRVKVAGRRLKPGQVVEAVIGPALSRASGQVGARARDRDASKLPSIAVVFEDDDIVVVDKPVGLLAAPTPEGDRGNVADMLGRGKSGQILVVHRIDLPTSGLLVYAKNAHANRELSAVFRDHSGDRRYFAIVAGRWPDDVTTIDSPIAGRAAVSHFIVESRLDDATALEVVLDTGRTHQIRIHCSEAGHPVLGDLRYGAPHRLAPDRLALHAKSLGFPHPRTGEAMAFESPVPESLRRLLGDHAGDD